MTCSEIRPQLMDYALRRLSAADAGAIVTHIGECPECRAVLEEERLLCGLLATVPVPAPERDLWDAVRARRTALEMSRSVSTALPPAALHARRRVWASWTVALSAGIAALTMMLAPTKPAPEPVIGTHVIAQTLDQARQASRGSDDPLSTVSENTWDVLSGTGEDAS